ARAVVQRSGHAPARAAPSGRYRPAAGRTAAAAADLALARFRAQCRAAAGRALAGRLRYPPDSAPDPLFGRTVAGDRARRDQDDAARTDAPRLRGQRLARVAHAADRCARLPGHARPGGASGLGAHARRYETAIATYDRAA